jgi:hypothetical protein
MKKRVKGRAWSLRKWDWLRKNKPLDDEEEPTYVKRAAEAIKMPDFECSCSYCQYYKREDNGNCKGCPLDDSNICSGGYGIYGDWCAAVNGNAPWSEIQKLANLMYKEIEKRKYIEV